MSRSSQDPELFVPLLSSLRDDLRRAAWMLVAEVLRAELERRDSILTSVERAFDAVLAKPGPRSTRLSPEDRPRKRLRNVAPHTPSRDPEDALAIETEEAAHEVPGTASARAASSAATNGTPRAEARQDPREEVLSTTRSESATLGDGTASLAEDASTLARGSERIARARARRAAVEGAREPDEESSTRSTPSVTSIASARAFGTVKRFDAFRGFGFILAPDGGEDYFVHVKYVVADDRVLVEGLRVSYMPRQGQRGRFAVDVRPVAAVG